MINNVALEGRFLKDTDEVRKSSTGNSFVSFTICVSRKKDEAPMFVNCTAFGFQADRVAKLGKKGCTALISGNLSPAVNKEGKQIGLNLLVDQMSIFSKNNVMAEDTPTISNDDSVFPW
jgi:single-stranded DNA-binding protein